MTTNSEFKPHSWLRLISTIVSVMLLTLMIASQAFAADHRMTPTSASCTFTKLPGPATYIQAGYVDVDVLVFEMNCSNPKFTGLKQMDFSFDPPIPVSWEGPGLRHFRLIYFQNGVKHPGTTIAFDDGATFNGSSMRLGGMSLSVSKTFKGEFALRVDVTRNFTTSYPFTTSLTGVTLNVAGVDQPLVSPTLPLTGDTFHVVQN